MPACAHLLVGPPEQAGRTTDHIARRMRQQVERVLHAPRALQRTRIDRHTQGLGQLPIVERLGALGQLDGAFEHAAIHVGGDQPFAKLLQRALGKRRRFRPRHPSTICTRRSTTVNSTISASDMPRYPVRASPSPSRRRQRRFPRTRGAVHGSQFVLKRVVKQLVPMDPQKPEELPDSIRDASTETALAGSGQQAVSNARSSSACLLGPRPPNASDHRPHPPTHRKI